MGLNLKNLTKKNENNQIDPIKIFDILPKKMKNIVDTLEIFKQMY